MERTLAGLGKGSHVLQGKAELLVAVLSLKALGCWIYSYDYFYRVNYVVIRVL